MTIRHLLLNAAGLEFSTNRAEWEIVSDTIFTSIVDDKLGNSYSAGTYNDNGTQNFIIESRNAVGDQRWNYSYLFELNSNPVNLIPTKIIVTRDTRLIYILADGYNDLTYSNNYDEITLDVPDVSVIVCLDSNTGDVVWSKTVSNADLTPVKLTAADVDASSSLYCLAIDSLNTNVFKIDRVGNYKWSKRFKKTNSLIPVTGLGLSIGALKYIYVAGTTENQLFLNKLNLDGELIWRRKVPINLIPTGLDTRCCDNIFVIGNVNQTDITILNFTSDGLVQWNKTVNKSLTTYSSLSANGTLSLTEDIICTYLGTEDDGLGNLSNFLEVIKLTNSGVVLLNRRIYDKKVKPLTSYLDTDKSYKVFLSMYDNTQSYTTKIDDAFSIWDNANSTVTEQTNLIETYGDLIISDSCIQLGNITYTKQ
jgi:hypothetical protein